MVAFAWMFEAAWITKLRLRMELLIQHGNLTRFDLQGLALAHHEKCLYRFGVLRSTAFRRCGVIIGDRERLRLVEYGVVLVWQPRIALRVCSPVL